MRTADEVKAIRDQLKSLNSKVAAESAQAKSSGAKRPATALPGDSQPPAPKGSKLPAGASQPLGGGSGALNELPCCQRVCEATDLKCKHIAI